MTAQDCLQILREVKDAAFATVDENGYPQVRIIDVMLVEDGTIYFCTARGKDFYQQLARTGRAAVTALNKDYQMVRLSGKVKRLTDQKKWIDRIFEENPSMKEVYPQDSRYILEPFCFEEGQVEFFDLGKSPIYRENFTLGDVKRNKKDMRSRMSASAAELAWKDVRSAASKKVRRFQSGRKTAFIAVFAPRTARYRPYGREVDKDDLGNVEPVFGTK